MSLRDLLKKNPYGFLELFGKEGSKIEAARLEAQNPGQTFDPEEVLEDDGGLLSFVEESVSNLQVDGLSLREVYSKGGGEGGGDTVIRVYAVVDGATRKRATEIDKEYGFTPGLKDDGTVLAYIRVTGYYASYEGTTWDEEAEFVFPHEVKVTKYVNAKELKKLQKDQA